MKLKALSEDHGIVRLWFPHIYELAGKGSSCRVAVANAEMWLMDKQWQARLEHQIHELGLSRGSWLAESTSS